MMLYARKTLGALGLTSAPMIEDMLAAEDTSTRLSSEGGQELLSLAQMAALSEDDELLLRLAEALHMAPITPEQSNRLLMRGWEEAMEQAREEEWFLSRKKTRSRATLAGSTCLDLMTVSAAGCLTGW